MAPERSPDERTCPVCDTRLPDDPAVRRCPRCGARALLWAEDRQPEQGVVLFNARLAGIMAGALVAMLGLLLLGYRFPIPWGVAITALALPVGGYIAFGETARTVPRSWRTHYLVGVLALNAGLLAATIAAVMGLMQLLPLLAIAIGLAGLVWPIIRRAVTESTRSDDA
ncbi:MAG: hypothetical protein GF393_02550 [Armatimonadia bacterium]|nr:hypothetical protein [Armatimonadia bacterium]